MKPHKFVTNDNPASHYDRIVFCEYCGLIAFHGNYPDKYSPQSGDCPNSPELPQKENP